MNSIKSSLEDKYKAQVDFISNFISKKQSSFIQYIQPAKEWYSEKKKTFTSQQKKRERERETIQHRDEQKF